MPLLEAAATPSNVDDRHAPDINSNAVDILGLKTATGLNCPMIRGRPTLSSSPTSESSGSTKKQAEHRGFCGGRYQCDAARLEPHIKPGMVSSFVETNKWRRRFCRF
jgi:hypothetical protein